MEGAPADMGDWSLVRVFHEGGRLLKKHFGDFLPIMLVFIFPVCLTKVCYTQFYEGPTDPEPTPLWILRALQIPLDSISLLSILAGLRVINQVVKGKIYVGYDKSERRSESFYTTVKLALSTTKVETETSAKLAVTTTKVDTETSALLNGRFRKTYNAKVLKALGALIVLSLLFVVIPTTEIKFTPEAIAAVGLPPWTILLFTLLIALYTTLATSYFLLVCVVAGVWWTWSPQTLLLV